MKRVKCVKVENLFGYWKFTEGDEHSLILDEGWLIVEGNGSELFVNLVDGLYIGECMGGVVATFTEVTE